MIFLIGMPGSGKTYWLQPFSEIIRYQPIDLDNKIEEKYQRSIARYFKNREEEFRLAEREMLKEVINSAPENTILATGGGTPCFFNNIDLMKENGTVVYLKADKDLIFNHLAKELNKRPFIPKTKNKLIHYIDDLIEERTPCYEKADLTLPVKYLNLTFFLDQIIPFISNESNN